MAKSIVRPTTHKQKQSQPAKNANKQVRNWVWMFMTFNQFIHYQIKLAWGKYFHKQCIGFFPQVILVYVRRFFINNSLSNNYLHHWLFLLSSLWVKKFFHQWYLLFYLIFATGLGGFTSKGHWFSSCYPIRFGGFLLNCKIGF